MTTTRRPATDIGWLLHKHPARVQTFDLAFGRAHVFYPEATDTRCTAALLLDVDPIGLVRPAIKCRGPEYLRIIYGPEYTSPEHLQRLRNRRLGRKRMLALREFALGVEALERFVRREPLRRVHECVFASSPWKASRSTPGCSRRSAEDRVRVRMPAIAIPGPRDVSPGA